jgi:hypothetical protein
MKLNFAALLLLAAIPLSGIAAEGPFGFFAGMTKAQIEKRIKIKGNPANPFVWVATSAPKPHQSFSLYRLIVDPKLGLCYIEAFGKSIYSPGAGTDIRLEFDRITKQIGLQYMPIADENIIDTLDRDGVFRMTSSWTAALATKQATLMAHLDSSSESPLPNRINRIGIMADGVSLSTARIVAFFQFDNGDQCEENRQKALSRSF